MLGRLVLVILQLMAGVAGGPLLQRYVSLGGDAQQFANAAIYAVIVFVVGLIAAQIIKDVPTPSPSALVYALVGAMVGAVIVVTGIYHQIPLKMPQWLYPLGLAVVGYTLKR